MTRLPSPHGTPFSPLPLVLTPRGCVPSSSSVWRPRRGARPLSWGRAPGGGGCPCPRSGRCRPWGSQPRPGNCEAGLLPNPAGPGTWGQAGRRAPWPGGGSGPLPTLTTVLRPARETRPRVQLSPGPSPAWHLPSFGYPSPCPGAREPEPEEREFLGRGLRCPAGRHTSTSGAEAKAPGSPCTRGGPPEGETLLLTPRLEGRSRQREQPGRLWSNLRSQGQSR